MVDGRAPDPRALVIACGALAREIAVLRRANRWMHLDVQCLPPELHNHPKRITGAVREKIRANRERYATIIVAYGDCGTGGELDAMLAEEQVHRLRGAHCYEMFAGSAVFASLAEEEPGTFYLTDFLLRHFERLVIGALGLDRHPQLREQYFGNYRRLVYLAQVPSDTQIAAALIAAQRLGLAFEFRCTGLQGLEQPIDAMLPGRRAGRSAASVRLVAA
jgi:hypothetical protein